MRELVHTIFTRHKTSADNAKCVAEALVQAQIDGQAGHGLSRVASYAGQSLSGKVDGYATPKVQEVGGAAVRIDACYGFAYPAIHLALEELCERASTQGTAVAAIHNSHHFGVAGYHAEKLADKGLVGLVLGNSPKAIAPWGGHKGLFGTNPIAFAAPRRQGPSLVIDLSLSKVARGKVMVAAKEGQAIPEGWALDDKGQPTTDAKAALAGTMLPMGDAKGAALVLMVEIIAAAVTGAHFGFEASSFFDAEGKPPAVGQFFIAINPGKLSGDQFIDRIETLIETMLVQPGVRLPGQRRLEARENAKSQGVIVPDTLYQDLQRLVKIETSA